MISLGVSSLKRVIWAVVLSILVSRTSEATDLCGELNTTLQKFIACGSGCFTATYAAETHNTKRQILTQLLLDSDKGSRNRIIDLINQWTSDASGNYLDILKVAGTGNLTVNSSDKQFEDWTKVHKNDVTRDESFAEDNKVFSTTAAPQFVSVLESLVKGCDRSSVPSYIFVSVERQAANIFLVTVEYKPTPERTRNNPAHPKWDYDVEVPVSGATVSPALQRKRPTLLFVKGAPVKDHDQRTITLPPGYSEPASVVLVTDNGGAGNALLTPIPAHHDTPPPPTTLSPSLVAFWRGEDTPWDSVGHRNAKVMGSLTYGNGKVGQAFRFDGSSFLDTVFYVSYVDGVTFATWVNTETKQAVIMSDGGGSSGHSCMGLFIENDPAIIPGLLPGRPMLMGSTLDQW